MNNNLTSINQSRRIDLILGCSAACLSNTKGSLLYNCSLCNINCHTSLESAQCKLGKGESFSSVGVVKKFLKRNCDTVDGDVLLIIKSCGVVLFLWGLITLEADSNTVTVDVFGEWHCEEIGAVGAETAKHELPFCSCEIGTH